MENTKKAGKCATIFLPEIQKTSKKILTIIKSLSKQKYEKKMAG